MLDLTSPLARMAFDTFLKSQRENIREAIEEMHEIVTSFDTRFATLEDKIDAILAKQADNDAKAELLDVLEDLAEGKSLDDALGDKPALIAPEGDTRGAKDDTV